MTNNKEYWAARLRLEELLTKAETKIFHLDGEELTSEQVLEELDAWALEGGAANDS